jgi:hypothetical protein
MNVVENVTGDVSLVATKDFANSGTQHDGGAHPSRLLRTHYYFPPLDCLCKNIHGDLNIWFNRVDLAIEGVTGKIDVRNEFGDSTLTINTALANDCHRVISESGRVEVILSTEMLGELPLYAVTQCGTVRTNAPSEFLDTLNMGTHDDGVMRGWSGFRRIQPGEERHFFFAERFSTAFRGDAREPGLDLISRGGAVVVTTP